MDELENRLKALIDQVCKVVLKLLSALNVYEV